MVLPAYILYLNFKVKYPVKKITSYRYRFAV